MKFFVALICAALAVASCNAVAGVHPRGDFSLAQYLMSKQVAAIVTDPSVSSECFSLYMPLLTEAVTVWSTDYQQCIDYAANNRTQVMNEMSQQQADMTKSANEVCSFITNCETISDTLDYFNCFAGLSKNEIGTVYAISDNATVFATTLVQELEVINVNMYLCTNATERAYVETTAAIYDALDNCLQNGLPATQPTEEPTTTTTPEPTTTASTAAPTTAAPTDAPTNAPTDAPTDAPTAAPTAAPVANLFANNLSPLSRFRRQH